MVSASGQDTTAAQRRQTSFKEDTAERPPEVLVEHSVDDGVEHGVHVAKPEGDGERLVRDGAPRAERSEDIEREEGQPARNEGAHDEAQDERGPLLLLARQAPLLPLWVPLGGPRRLHHFHHGLLAAGHAAHVYNLTLRLGSSPSAKDRLAQPQLERLHYRAPAHYPRVRRGGVELAHHVRIDAHRRLPHPLHGGCLLGELAVNGEDGAAVLQRPARRPAARSRRRGDGGEEDGAGGLHSSRRPNHLKRIFRRVQVRPGRVLKREHNTCY